MRFSTIAVSAAVFGATAMAMPGSVVYQTEVVTITSCAPEKTNCPARSSTAPCPPVPSAGFSVPAPPNGTFVSPAPTGKPVCSGGAYCPPAAVTSSPAGSTPAPVCPGSPNVRDIPLSVLAGSSLLILIFQCPPVSMTVKPVASVIPGTGLPSVPSGTGVPQPPMNTSVPVVPSTPPTFTGSASIQTFSILAVGAAVAAFFL
ncbi:hypothetical protein L873DRAFT_1682664 [Choiromyces venosus 120613-1]|uniref:GPI anchored serine-rich protein n=1 Tax=Choiromyces venosus 120613-1 TaxID=1336337 RepID=A0A3N4JN48_9PEZI|nr:hypothetical protein L873DRAFT_1682664 [Choiromyces venosus 120613-1]